MGNELMCTMANGVETIAEKSTFDFKLQGWPAAVTLVGCVACIALVSCKYIDSKTALHAMSAGTKIV